MPAAPPSNPEPLLTAPPARLILLGHAGAGKTTLATRLVALAGRPVPRLSLDTIAWGAGTERRPLADSVRLLHDFQDAHDHWILEGCYGDLIACALPRCDALWFLNPGVAVCLEHCRRRPFEPDKFSSPAAQQAQREALLAWVRTYETRDDEYGLSAHRRLFDGCNGPKWEYRRVADYSASVGSSPACPGD